MNVELDSITPDPESRILECARVSSENPNSKDTRLIQYLIKNKHWSPFEMVHMCLKVTTTRAISRQILRHRTFSFQEFSQRYAAVKNDVDPILVEARRQDTKNRQNSIDDLPQDIKDEWLNIQKDIYKTAMRHYNEALSKGIAKEVARSILPEGLTPTTFYMTGSLRTWIHYIELRTANGTQKEHVEVAKLCQNIFKQECPIISKALNW